MSEIFNSSSNDHISTLLFGGDVPYEEKEYIGITKTGKNKGQDRYRTVKKRFYTKGVGLEPREEWKSKKEGKFQTNEEVLNIIAKGNHTEAKEIAEIILKIRQLNKELSTYFDSTREVVHDIDNCIHPNFIHVWTDTGRLSHRNPNVGNQPKPPSKAMEHFISRFNNGYIISADYSQLELVVQSQISEDQNYIKDVQSGIDFHVKRLAMKEELDYNKVLELVNQNIIWKQKRSKIKEFSFQRAYGAGVNSISMKTGISKEDIQSLINKEEKEYPRLFEWQKDLKKQVLETGYYVGITGRQYKFRLYPSPEWKKKFGENTQYSPTEIINYIVQGTATGDLVPIMIGKFWRDKALYNRNKYLMINTIHDNLMLDCKEEFKEEAKKDLKILENWKEVCNNNFKYNWKVDIKVDINSGINWYECN